MEKCEICNSKFKDKDALLSHIMDRHSGDGDTAIEITPEVCDELGLTETEINVVKSSLATGASDTELMYFLKACQSYGLSPIKKEIYYTKMGGKVTLVVSRDGYLTLAHRNPLFRGIHSDVVHEKDDLSIHTSVNDDGAMVQEIDHRYPGFGARGKVVGAWSRIDMANQAPVVVLVKIEDYDKGTPIWKQYKSAMIIKCAESIALKKVSDAAGLVSAAEIMEAKTPSNVRESEIADIEANVIDAEYSAAMEPNE